METQNVLLDMELTEQQIRALEIHMKLKSNGAYEVLGDLDPTEYDLVQVWFEIQYNDYTYDVLPIYCDLIKDDAVIRKINMGREYEFEIQYYDGTNLMQSYSIRPHMLRAK